MLTAPSIGPVDVAIYGCVRLDPDTSQPDEMADGEKMTGARVDGCGDTVALWQFDNLAKRYARFDRLTDCEATYSKDGNHVTIKGVSDLMVEQIGLSREDAHVRWEIDMRGCQTCG